MSTEISVFQSTPLMRGETTMEKANVLQVKFQSTPLMRGETRVERPQHFPLSFQSTPLMRGETLKAAWREANVTISIHSPHARGDSVDAKEHVLRLSISIHSPHARGDPPCGRVPTGAKQFQSTPLMRGETQQRHSSPYVGSKFQSTPLMRGETSSTWLPFSLSVISIHSPHARGDDCRRLGQQRQHISIHSPHARGDSRRL